MGKSFPVPCSCGKAVPAYVYCHGCRQVHGNANCPCGRPVKGIKTQECLGCNPADAERIKANISREYRNLTGLDCSGDCRIPTCPTCTLDENPITRCEACGLDECVRCAAKCRSTALSALTIKKTEESSETLTYSGAGKRYKKDADKHRPAMFVEAWYYKGGQLTNRTLTGFKRKEA